MSTTAQGIRFEERTAQALRNHGFAVERNLLLAGSQIDLFARQRVGVVDVELVVECKDEQQAVGVDTVRTLHVILVAIQGLRPRARGLIVARVGYTKEATQYAGQVGIDLKTIHELEDWFARLLPYAAAGAPLNQSAADVVHYVPLDGQRGVPIDYPGDASSGQGRLGEGLQAWTVTDDRAGAALLGVAPILDRRDFTATSNAVVWAHRNARRIADVFGAPPETNPKALILGVAPEAQTTVRQATRVDLMGAVLNWLPIPKAGCVLILGDYGTGKSTFLRALMARATEDFLMSKGESRCPLLVQLRDHPNGLTESGLLQTFIDRTGLHGFRQDELRTAMEQGKLLLLLDGFDEMGFNGDPFHRRAHFASLLRFLRPHGAKVVITGRPGYFPTDSEVGEALESAGDEFAARIDTWGIAPFTDQQIGEYLTAVGAANTGFDPERARATIGRVYNLGDLARRPFLLSLVVGALPEIESAGDRVSAASLYRHFTRKWIEREAAKGEFRLMVTPRQKLGFMSEVAWLMLLNNTLSIHFSHLEDFVRLQFNLDNQGAVDNVAHDVRTCSFLTRDAAGNYAFAHRSFMEYFLAVYVERQISAGEGAAVILERAHGHAITRNSLKFCIELIGERVDCAIELLTALSPVDGSLCRLLRLTETLPERVCGLVLTRLRAVPELWSTVSRWQTEANRADRALVHPAGAGSGRKRKKRRGRRQGDEVWCSYCRREIGRATAPLAWGGYVMCMGCLEAAKIILFLRQSTADSADAGRRCSRCDRSALADDLVWNRARSLCVCKVCINSVIDIMVGSPAPPFVIPFRGGGRLLN